MSGSIAAASVPRGGRVTYWDVPRGTYLGHTELADGSGVSPMLTRGRFLLTSGDGRILSSGPGAADEPLTLTQAVLPFAWDNHAARAW